MSSLLCRNEILLICVYIDVFGENKWHNLLHAEKYVHDPYVCCVMLWLDAERFYPCPSGLHHWSLCNYRHYTIDRLPVKQPWRIWLDTYMNWFKTIYVNKTKQSTMLACVYCIKYVVVVPFMAILLFSIHWNGNVILSKYSSVTAFWLPPVIKISSKWHHFGCSVVNTTKSWNQTGLYLLNARSRNLETMRYVFWFVDRLQWCHNGHDAVSNHQSYDCLLNRLFWCSSKKKSNLCVTGHCAGNSSATGEFPAQMSSKAENVSIWWRHHAKI